MLDITFEETRVFQEVREDAMQEGRKEEAANLIIRQLGKRFGELSEDIQASVSKLSLTVLEELGEALLDFSGISEVQNWLAEHSG